ncbi:hypothetical protein LSH36_3g01030 [Paralvinella palmiformis]|uniref:G-protein coupled receptors family 2 profile 2 domain-containing protein n=1 Tax=Paralvinella palmiformis TaxID=53620 RepID=A0AAD9NIY6_9ANNE|nr:hypothetical protein LSH36_3g01030 [Paralvinella palmiformis]
MANGGNTSCHDICPNGSDASVFEENASCPHLCNDSVRCLFNCQQPNNSTAGTTERPGDLLVFLENPSTIEGLLFLVGNVISVTCLVSTVLVHLFLKKQLWTIQGQSLTSLIVALFFAKLAFQVNPYFNVNKYLCSLVSILQHYFCMSAFLWLSVLIYSVSKFTSLTEIAAKKGKTVLMVYIAYAWGVPSMAVMTCLVVEFLLRFGSSYGNARAKKIRRSPEYETMNASKRKEMLFGHTDIEVKGHSVRSYFTVSVLMTTAWLTGFAASNQKQFCTLWFCDWWIFFVILNCLQGVYIFMNFSLNQEVYALLQEKCYMRMRRLRRFMRKGVRKRPRLQRSKRYKEMNEEGIPSTFSHHNIQTISGTVNDTSSV